MESELSFDKYPFLKELGLAEDNPGVYAGGNWFGSGNQIISENPGDGSGIARVVEGNLEDYKVALKHMQDSQKAWINTPMPKRGEIVRLIGNQLRKYKKQLGALVSLEVGKIIGEGQGEVQEFIDCCDMACGMSRKIGGQVFKSERQDHYMVENWNPLGIIGCITAFNFPNAVYGWNLAIALICGDLVMWKPSPTTPLTSIATMKIIDQVFKANGVPLGVCTMLCSGVEIGKAMVADPEIKLISFTGSTWVGRSISNTVSQRFGKCILELGGNNCSIICEDANLDLAIRGCCFGSVGTSGQRCTTLRRLVIHESVYENMKNRLLKAYSTVVIGDQMDPKTLMGPVHNKMVMDIFTKSIQRVKEAGGKIICGGEVIEREGYYCQPTIVEITPDCKLLQEELFCPILFIMRYKTFEEAVQINNSVPQGLSSSIFTNNLQRFFKWIGPNGSDCGLVNCNMGPSGAEIGGAFGGEKETGGGRESGSDAWKQYMKRQTCTINFGNSLPLAQGIKFDV